MQIETFYLNSRGKEDDEIWGGTNGPLRGCGKLEVVEG